MTNLLVDWAEAYSNLREALGMEIDLPAPELQRRQQIQASAKVMDHAGDETPPIKRKHAADEDVEPITPAEDSMKRPKKGVTTSQPNGQAGLYLAVVHAKAAAAYIPFLQEEMLMPPKMPTHEEMENVILDLRKRALVEEYFGDKAS